MERYMQASFEAEEAKTRERACRFIAILLGNKWESPNKLDAVIAEANELHRADDGA